jgi:23S rRNA (adenine-N6)-dimethyltransferase
MSNEYVPGLRYSQNELTNGPLLRRLVRQAGIHPGDVVYDIGAGKGAITRALLEAGASVIAVEKDRELYLRCQQLSRDGKGLTALRADFRDLTLPARGPYKVFANIPFFHTADIIRKLLFANNPPRDCYLVVQKEAAEKYAGIPRESLMSLLVKPVFWTDIVVRLDRRDFTPVPSVDVVLLQFQLRTCRLVAREHYRRYRDFVIYCRESGRTDVKAALRRVFTFNQVRRSSRLLGFDYHQPPRELTFSQYLGLFQAFLAEAGGDRASVDGAEARFMAAREGQAKRHRTSVREAGP